MQKFTTFFIKKLIIYYRYKNILPYDHSRIQLKDKIALPIQNSDCDYINASWITKTKDAKEANGRSSASNRNTVNSTCSNISFMACQGPTPFTIHHHLQMIHEQKADVVVMLTRLVETAGQSTL